MLSIIFCGISLKPDSNTADRPITDVLEEYGPYFIYYTMSIGYDRMLRSLGPDFGSFIDNLDNIHTMLEVCYADLRTPQFR